MARATDGAGFGAAALSLRRFCRWWSGELATCVPVSLRPAARFLNDATFIEIEGRRIRAKQWRAGRLQALDELDLAPLPLAEQPLALRAWLGRSAPATDALALVLRPGDALSRLIEMPQAAEDDLGQAIAYELNRYTPFKAGEVYFDYRRQQRAPGERGLRVQIAVAPKGVVDAALNLLAQAGARPAAVVLGEDLSAERMPLNLLPRERRMHNAPRSSAANSMLAALALVLIAVALALPVWQKRQAVAVLSPLVEGAKRETEGVEHLRKELDTLVQTYDFLLQRKHAHPAATLVMEELTRRLPDGTWLQQLSLRSHPKGWEIQIQGETTISSRLASVIEDSPLFRDAGFKSPLVKGQAQASERFHLGAELELAAAPKAQRLADKQLPERATAVRAADGQARGRARTPGSAAPASALAAPKP